MKRPASPLVLAAVLSAIAVSGCALGQATEATSVQATKATLNGEVSAVEEGAVEYWFEYGPTTATGSEGPHRSLTVSDNDPHAVSEPVEGLTFNTDYRFRLCARNAGQDNANCAGDKTFTTSDHDGARFYVDRPDDHPAGTQQIHLLYVLPSDRPDRSLDTNGAIAASVGVAEQWMSGQTGGQPFRLDTTGGEPDITFVRLESTNAELAANGGFIRDEIEDQLEERGFTDPDKVYPVYYDGTANEVCANGSWPPALPGHVVALYLDGQFSAPSIPDCGTNPLAATGASPGYWEFVFLHELMHAMGAVPTCAPNHAFSGHTGNAPTDLMYAGNQPWQPSVLDPGHDDYFGHGRSNCLDVARSGYLVGNGAAPLPGEGLAAANRARAGQVPQTESHALGQVSP